MDTVPRRGVRRWIRRPIASWTSVRPPHRWAWFFIVLALLTGAVAWMTYDHNRVLARSGIVARATVVETFEPAPIVDRFSQPSVTVKFRTRDGQLAHGVVEHYAWHDLQRGDVVRVLYAPQDPSYYIRDADVGPDPLWRPWGAACLLCLFFAAACYVYGFKAPGSRRVRRSE